LYVTARRICGAFSLSEFVEGMGRVKSLGEGGSWITYSHAHNFFFAFKFSSRHVVFSSLLGVYAAPVPQSFGSRRGHALALKEMWLSQVLRRTMGLPHSGHFRDLSFGYKYGTPPAALYSHSQPKSYHRIPNRPAAENLRDIGQC
jgi:hypothetical protein